MPKKAQKKTSASHKTKLARPHKKRKTLAKLLRIKKPTKAIAFEDVLISKSVLPNQPKNASPILIEVLYNLTPSTRSLGYLSGFSVGTKIAQNHNPHNTISALVNLLESAGFSDVLYYPQGQSAIIQAKHHQDCKLRLGATLHIFEAGLIAGYLSESTKIKMNVVERTCSHASHQSCRFVAEHANTINEPNAFEGTTELSDSIMHALHNRSATISMPYFSLAISPLCKSPIKEQLSKLLFMLGKQLSNQVNLSQLANLEPLFGLVEIDVAKKGQHYKSIGMRFNHFASSKSYLDIASAFFSGILSVKAQALPKQTRTLNKDGTYTLVLKI